MTSDTKPKAIMRLDLDADEASYLAWCIMLAHGVLSTNEIDVANASVFLLKVLETAGVPKINALQDRFQALMDRAFSEIPKVEKIVVGSEDCTHCECSSKRCCWCGKPKPQR